LIKLFKPSDTVIVLHESSPTGISKIQISNEVSRIILIIGPEGGISEDELSQLISAGAVTARMGDLVLRSAHAGFAALAAIQSSIGRW
jgi:16S rRNA (uracil1498-N3)-methyltransferase